MFTLNNISVHFSGTYLFEDVSVLINPRDRIGLVGRNGAGKTTLLRVLNREISPEKGEAVIPSDKLIGYLPQQMRITSQEAVVAEARKAFAEVLDLHHRIERMNDEIAHRTDYESNSYHKLIDDLTHANERYLLLGGHSIDAEVERTLAGLGFKPEEMDRPMNTFSGGWQMRVELAKILLRKPDLLLLDEPTNHLDIESIQWLEGFLDTYPGAVVLVSHDRAFLDKVTSRTLEISGGKFYDYKASYSGYIEMRESVLEQQIATFTNQQREIAQIERFIERFRSKNTKASQVQSRIKLLEKMEKVEVDLPQDAAIHFRFPPAPRSGRVVFEAKNVTKAYGEKVVLKNVDLAIQRGDFVAFVGRNGEGKTTLSRIIVGELEHQGEAVLGHNVSIGYYAQNQAELLNGDKTVFQVVDDVATGDMRTRVRTMLGNFLFSGEDIEKKVKVLSGGERSRLALCRMLFTPVNLLVLDEPTNHLDMRSKDILKNALLQYDGTLVIVSHDRDFLQGLTSKVYEFRNRRIREYIGDIYAFLESRRLSTLSELERKAAQARTTVSEPPSVQKVLREERKEHEKGVRKLKNQLGKIEEEIHHRETEQSLINIKLADPLTYARDIEQYDLFSRYESLKKEIEVLMQDWEKLAGDIEALEGRRRRDD
jgi:ATP-binding cassette subfamily F protein 3